MKHAVFARASFAIALGSSCLAFATEPDANHASLPAAPAPSPELLVHPSGPRSSSGMHPRVVLRDTRGEAVRDSSQPIDVKTTCGSCHDVGWIASHGFHFGQAANAPSLILTGDTPADRAPNCFFCHVRHAAVDATRATLAAGDARWIGTATLLDTGLVIKTNELASSRPAEPFAYVKELIDRDGTVSADQLQLGPPSNQACGACHGLVTRKSPSLEDWLSRPSMTERTGQVYSPDRVENSTLNLQGRDELSRSWDVHAERLLNCSDCHYAQNDPRARALVQTGSLRLEPRHAGISAFLRRPSHDFARGRAELGCENCHDSKRLHAFLPHLERHMARLSCEVCHIPKSLVPALREVDYTLPDGPAQPRLAYRGIDGKVRDPGAFVRGFAPGVVGRRDAAGHVKLAPANFVTTFSWRQGSAKGAVIEQTLVDRTLFDANGTYRPELVTALDRNRDGQLQDSERQLDNDEGVAGVARLLAQAGAKEPTRVGEVRAVLLHHGIVRGRYAVRDCADCHAAHSRLNGEVLLTTSLSHATQLIYLGDPAETSVEIRGTGSSPSAFAKLDETRNSTYVFGSSRSRWLDTAGLSFASLALLGVIAHGGLRIRGAYRRRRPR